MEEDEGEFAGSWQVVGGEKKQQQQTKRKNGGKVRSIRVRSSGATAGAEAAHWKKARKRIAVKEGNPSERRWIGKSGKNFLAAGTTESSGLRERDLTARTAAVQKEEQHSASLPAAPVQSGSLRRNRLEIDGIVLCLIVAV
jgi:hypothetical protein